MSHVAKHSIIGRLQFAAALLGAALLSVQPAFAGEQEVVQALSVHGTSHPLPSAEELETMAGGEDALVEILLNYRTKETPPFVGIRAQKLLLAYADRQDVQDALAADVQSEEHFGLARIVSLHFDSVEDQGARQRLAKGLIERGKREARFERYAKSLMDSGDEEVKRMAREAFR